MSLAPEENLKRPGTRCGWRPHTVCLQECLMHSDFDGPQVLSTAVLAPCLESVPASLVWALVTHQIWPCSSQTLCIRLVIAHVHPQGDSHQSTRGLLELRTLLPLELRTLLPTSCIQVLSSTFMAHLRLCFDREGNFSCSHVFNLGDMSLKIWSEITTVR